MDNLKNITKMDYPKQDLHGYYVRIQRDGKQHAKMFSVTQYGSMEEALAQAMSYRDQILNRWKAFCGKKDEVIQYQTTNSGYPGISITSRNGRPLLEINLRDEDGNQKGRTLTLPPKDSTHYEREFDKQFSKAKAMVDDHNRKRFGGRWYAYKKRKELVE